MRFVLTYYAMLGGFGSDRVKVSASEHRAVTNGRDERRIEKRFRRGVITSEGWFLTPKMSSKGPLFVKKNPGAVLGVVVEKNKT